MKILIILPNWLGDAIMATPAIELLTNNYPNASFTFVGSFVSIEALKYHPKVEKTYIDTTKKSSNRFLSTYKFAKKLGEFDLAITFRNQVYSSLLLYFTKSKQTIARSSWHTKILLTTTPSIDTKKHLVEQYVELLKTILPSNAKQDIPQLKLYIKKEKFLKPTLGINAGATYGSAKRWYPEKFAQVAASLSSEYNILIFGGPNEVEMAKDIEKELDSLHITNYENIAGTTSIQQLCAKIAGCSLFITNDSGPMHIAAAYQVPTVSIFGPTKYKETSQWKNNKSSIVRKELQCSPCMKRECPLKHHECMTLITPNDVIEKVKEIV